MLRSELLRNQSAFCVCVLVIGCLNLPACAQVQRQLPHEVSSKDQSLNELLQLQAEIEQFHHGIQLLPIEDRVGWVAGAVQNALEEKVKELLLKETGTLPAEDGELTSEQAQTIRKFQNAQPELSRFLPAEIHRLLEKHEVQRRGKEAEKAYQQLAFLDKPADKWTEAEVRGVEDFLGQFSFTKQGEVVQKKYEAFRDQKVKAWAAHPLLKPSLEKYAATRLVQIKKLAPDEQLEELRGFLQAYPESAQAREASKLLSQWKNRGEVLQTATELPEVSEIDLLEISPQDDEITILKKARYNALANALKGSQLQFETGLIGHFGQNRIDDYLSLTARMLKAQMDFEENPNLQLKLAERRLGTLKQLEQALRISIDIGRGRAIDLYQARAQRYEAEIEVLKRRRELQK